MAQLTILLGTPLEILFYFDGDEVGAFKRGRLPQWGLAHLRGKLQKTEIAQEITPFNEQPLGHVRFARDWSCLCSFFIVSHWLNFICWLAGWLRLVYIPRRA